MIKAIFFDVDGTLVSFRQKFLSDRTMADLSALRARGIWIFLSTGRALQDLERTGMLRGAEFDGYVTINGQFCCGRDGIPYRDRPIDLDDMRGAYQVLLDHPEISALLQGNGESRLTQINDRVREVFRLLLRTTLTVTVTSFLIVILFPRPLALIFNDNQELVSLVGKVMPIFFGGKNYRSELGQGNRHMAKKILKKEKNIV